tara:strand:- start:363 stop:554 length:192 start_codon:yes stop_codon:yes gene_type:complete
MTKLEELKADYDDALDAYYGSHDAVRALTRKNWKNRMTKLEKLKADLDAAYDAYRKEFEKQND